MEIFDQIDDGALIWFYCADRLLDQDEQRTILDALSTFVSSWESHGRQVVGDARILFDRIVIVTGVIPGGELSGCGIDASTRLLGQLAEDRGFGFVPLLDVVFRTIDGPVATLDRNAFRAHMATVDNPSEILILDRSVTTLADVREGRFEVPILRSWFSRYLPLKSA